MGYHGHPVQTAWTDRCDVPSIKMQELPLS